jgi:hypothetical protein
LPNNMWSIHPVFYVSMLKLSTPNTIPEHVESPPNSSSLKYLTWILTTDIVPESYSI